MAVECGTNIDPDGVHILVGVDAGEGKGVTSVGKACAIEGG